MGSITLDWKQEVIEQLNTIGLSPVVNKDLNLFSLSLPPAKLVISLLDLNDPVDPLLLISKQEQYHLIGGQHFHLWEDIWYTRRLQVLSRIKTVLGMNERIHARKAKIFKVSQDVADEFFNDNHLQYSASARYKYALVYEGRLVAIAAFSNMRKVMRGDKLYRSAELIRFATLAGYTVTGGFTKLLKHFIDQHDPDDVMSYADRDWSLGAAYERSGFELTGIVSPAKIFIDKSSYKRYFSHRLPEDVVESRYFNIFNTGNLKYLLKLR